MAAMGSPRTSIGAIFLPVVLLIFAVANLCSSADLPRVPNPSLEKELVWTRLAQGNNKPKDSPLLADHEQKLGSSYARPWPSKFTVLFITDYGTSPGLVAYDWTKQRQVIIHGLESTFCGALGGEGSALNSTKDSCQLFQDASGSYAYVASQQKCELIFPDVGCPPPTWPGDNSTYVGLKNVEGVGLCYGFAFGPPLGHIWYETWYDGLPCEFYFEDPAPSTMVFNPFTFNEGDNDEYFTDVEQACKSGAAAGITLTAE